MAAGRPSCEPGTLVVVAGPDARGKEVVVAAVKRRFACHAGIEFPVRIMTRPHCEGCDYLSVSRRVFRDMQREGAFALSWQAQGHDVAAPAGVLDSLRAGHLVVLVATHQAAQQAGALGTKVHLIELLAGPDGSRPLPAARMQAAAEPSASPMHRIWHGGDIAEAVRRVAAHVESLAAVGRRPVAPGEARQHGLGPAQRKRAPLEWRSPKSL